MNDMQIILSKIKSLPERPPFMLDSDIAMVYGSTTSRINQAVKRNPERFPEDFVFRLTKKEAESCGFEITDCDFKTDGRGGRRKPIYGFTREGCNMLSTVLNTPVAIARSIQIMRAFSAMERGETAAVVLIKDIAARLADMGERMKSLESRPPVHINLPDDTALPISLERKRAHSSNFQKGLKFPEVRELVLRLRGAGHTLDEVTAAVKAAWPAAPERHVTRSAAARFWINARTGRLKEFGIDVTVH